MTRLALTIVTVACLAGCGGSDEGGVNVDAAQKPADAAATAGDGGGNAADANTNPADANPFMADARPVGPGVNCINETCGMNQVCCPNQTPACVDPGQCTGPAFGCDGPEDCTTGNQVCCVTTGSECTAAQACTTVACRTTDDCGQGEMCCINSTVPYCATTCP